jgi:hypothetical protein
MNQRSVSPTFKSNALFYGDSDLRKKNTFKTVAKQSMPQSANTLTAMEGQAPRYAKGQKPRESTMNGIIGEFSDKPAIQPTKGIEIYETKKKSKQELAELAGENKQLKSQRIRKDTI